MYFKRVLDKQVSYSMTDYFKLNSCKDIEFKHFKNMFAIISKLSLLQ